MSARKVDYRKFQGLNIQILGISADDAFSQKAFADSLQLPYPLLSDHPDLSVIRRYAGTQPYPGDPGRLIAQRAFVLVDEQGIVRGKWLVEGNEVLLSDPILKKAQEIAGRP